MPANASPEYGHAEKQYLAAQTDEEKIVALEEMIRTMPQHKSAEALRANLRTRLKKLREKQEKAKKSGKGGKAGIKKEDMQACLVGFSNTGKSSLFSLLTGVKVSISPFPFTTKEPNVGMMRYKNMQIQLIDLPPLPNTDFSILNITDTIILVMDNLEQLNKSFPLLSKTIGKKIIIFNKSDLLSEEEKRKISSFLETKKLSFVIFSSFLHTNFEIEDLKKRIFETFSITRIFLKEPGREPGKEPLIIKPNSSLKDVAEKILKGFSSKVKRTRIWGPSSKFSGQIVGLDHIVKDMDTVEFQTK
jgi:small GTP-binding protein